MSNLTIPRAAKAIGISETTCAAGSLKGAALPAVTGIQGEQTQTLEWAFKRTAVASLCSLSNASTSVHGGLASIMDCPRDQQEWVLLQLLFSVVKLWIFLLVVIQQIAVNSRKKTGLKVGASHQECLLEFPDYCFGHMCGFTARTTEASMRL